MIFWALEERKSAAKETAPNWKPKSRREPKLKPKPAKDYAPKRRSATKAGSPK